MPNPANGRMDFKTERMMEDRIVRVFSCSIPKGIRNSGRLKKRWSDSFSSRNRV
jgi:hypothetical protein